MNNWLIYGANGYTGTLVAELASKRGENPILAGRNKPQLTELGQRLNLPVRTFSLSNQSEVRNNLKDIHTVLNCAGPFTHTFKRMLDACLSTKTNYLDVTGEIAVFEELFARDAEIRAAGITAISGVGFDVVPTDCLAAMVKERRPDAVLLKLGIHGVGAEISRGTAKTMFEGTAHGGAVRKDGKLIPVPLAYKTTKFDFDGYSQLAVTMPWGDLATAYQSTGIANIEVYFATTANFIMFLRAANLFRPLLASGFIQSLGKETISHYLTGPTEEKRAAGYCVIVAEAYNESKQSSILRMKCPEGYTLTAESALLSAEKIREGHIEKGALTPSMAFGADFIKSLSNIEIEIVA